MDRFWSKVDKTGVYDQSALVPDICWNWMGACDWDGYGQFRFGAKIVKAATFSYELVNGKVPDGKEIDHTCRNRKCVNPSHLEAVTHQENCKGSNGYEYSPYDGNKRRIKRRS